MLDTRLEMIFELLPAGIICDVGTDHCKLAAAAIKRGRATHAYATDLNSGPLDAAKRLIQKEGLSDKIDTFLSDGFLQIPTPEFEKTDCFVIAGMGGELIRSIISARHTDKYMVLQPMTAITELVQFLSENGYAVLKRTLCKDGDKIYTAMLVRYDGEKREPDYYGGFEKDALFYEYIDRECAKYKKAIDGIRSSDKSDKSRLLPLENMLFVAEREKYNENI